MRSILLTALSTLALSGTSAFASIDINGGASWGGWDHRGNSRDVGIWGAQSTTRSYELYTTVFTFNNNAATGGTQVRANNTPVGFASGAFSTGAFANGNTILGIGLRMNGSASAVGQNFVGFDLSGTGFQAASALGAADGRVSVSWWGKRGDFSAWFDSNAGPANLAVLNSDGSAHGGTGTYSNLVGGYGSGVSYDFAFRAFRDGAVGGGLQMFFDLTAMQDLYGGGSNFITNGWTYGATPIGAIGSNIKISLYNAEASHADASQVIFGVTVPAPGAIAALGLFGLAGTRRRR